MSSLTDSLGALNVFVQAADARSFTVAGRQLGISSSAVGKAVARLEERLGVTLFHRSTRAITLTPDGSMFLERCRRILSEMEVAELELSQRREHPGGVLRVSLPLVGMLMMPTLSAFMRAWPEIELDLDFTDRLVDVVEEGFDAVIRTGEASDSRLMTRALGEFRFKLVGAPAYFEQYGLPRTPGDLSAHRGLHHRYPSTGKLEEWLLVDADGALVESAPKAAVSSAIEPLLYMAEHAQGIAFLPDFAVSDRLADGTLVSILDDAVQRSGSFRILWPSSRHMSPKLRVFVDFMAQALFPGRGNHAGT
ncbi:LysR family transcriptional regulator [Henriciella aquimarina]|uniref:LysR family transcriptional regulator n=1 Tax=Henriciella aquimarina TaxID=545261 RepID=UPI0009FCED37|nr:LysR family transcriptional regulator [Henriciella aquimarina]